MHSQTQVKETTCTSNCEVQQQHGDSKEVGSVVASMDFQLCRDFLDWDLEFLPLSRTNAGNLEVTF